MGEGNSETSTQGQSTDEEMSKQLAVNMTNGHCHISKGESLSVSVSPEEHGKRKGSSRKRHSPAEAPAQRELWTSQLGELKNHDLNIINECRKRCRGDLALHDWTKQGYAWSTVATQFPTPTGHIAREHCNRLTKEEFVERYEKHAVPVLIDGIVDQWPAKTRWNIEVRHNVISKLWKVSKRPYRYTTLIHLAGII